MDLLDSARRTGQTIAIVASSSDDPDVVITYYCRTVQRAASLHERLERIGKFRMRVLVLPPPDLLHQQYPHVRFDDEGP